MEKDLRDYVSVLLKHKVLIISMTLIALILAFVLNFFIFSPVYRGSASVYIAQINNNPILKPKDVQALVTGDSFLQKISNDINVPYESIKNSVSVTTAQDSKVVLVNFDFKDKRKIEEFFKYFVLELNNFNNEPYQSQIDSLQNKITSLTSELEALEKQGEVVFAKLKDLEQANSTNAEYTLEYSQLISTYNAIISKKVDLVSNISDLKAAINNANMFFYQSEPVLLDTPVGPHKVFNTVITVFVAFIFSILLALFLERQNGK